MHIKKMWKKHELEHVIGTRLCAGGRALISAGMGSVAGTICTMFAALFVQLQRGSMHERVALPTK